MKSFDQLGVSHKEYRRFINHLKVNTQEKFEVKIKSIMWHEIFFYPAGYYLLGGVLK